MLQEDSCPLDIHRLCCITWSAIFWCNGSYFIRARYHVVDPECSCNIHLHVYQDKTQSQSREMYGTSQQTFIKTQNITGIR